MSPRTRSTHLTQIAAEVAAAIPRARGISPGTRFLVLIVEGDISDPHSLAVGCAHALHRTEAQRLLSATAENIAAGVNTEPGEG